jgi:hypothetical protein
VISESYIAVSDIQVKLHTLVLLLVSNAF